MNEKIYYHFLPLEHAISNLENKRMKISLIGELNDPFELLPYLRYGFKERQLYHNIRREVLKRYGLLCFSRRWSEPLLWGHYANNHKGIAIGFEVPKEEIKEVGYKSNPKRIKFELKNDIKHNEKLFLDLAKIKYEKWSYEEEYRMTVRLKYCEKVNDNYFIKFNDGLKVDEIVLGCKFDKEKRKEIINLARKLNIDENKIIHTRQSWAEYKINKCGTKTNELKAMYSQK